MSFWCLQFSQKTNENNPTWGTIVVKSNFFVCFLGELKIPKRHFEINWPLATAAYIFLVDVVSVATIWATAQYVERRLLHIFYLIHHQSIKVHVLNMWWFLSTLFKIPAGRHHSLFNNSCFTMITFRVTFDKSILVSRRGRYKWVLLFVPYVKNIHTVWRSKIVS